MDFLSNLVPEVPSLLDPTNPLHNMTLLTNTFFGAFLGTFIGSLAGQTVRHVLGKSDKYLLSESNRVINILYLFSNTTLIIFQSKTSQDKKDTKLIVIPSVD